MISFEDIRPQLKKFIQEGCETADYIMRVSKTPKDGIYAYEELGEIVRCRDCRYAIDLCDGTIDCVGPLTSSWDYYNDEPQQNIVGTDGYCAWGERKETK